MEQKADMQTKLVIINENDINKEALLEAGRIVRDGGLVAFPTETVYGLGGDALNPDSSCKIYEAKGRPSDNPLIVHIAKWEDIYRIAENVPEEACRLCEAFWPGPLTMILKKAECVPAETTGGLSSVAVRMPANETALAFIAAAGGYVAAPSANRSGRPSPTLAKYVMEDLDGRIDMVLDGGAVGIGLESTIVDLTQKKPMILRPGYITKDMLEKVLGGVEMDNAVWSAESKEPPRAPGMKYKHYAPQGELTIVSGKQEAVVSEINRLTAEMSQKGLKTGVIATEETRDGYRADLVKCVGRRRDEEAIAHNLYAALREFDDEGAQVIYSEDFTGSEIGQAIMNRLLKAAGHKIREV